MAKKNDPDLQLNAENGIMVDRDEWRRLLIALYRSLNTLLSEIKRLLDED